MGLLDGWRCQIEQRKDASWIIKLFDGEAHRAAQTFTLPHTYYRSEVIAKAWERWPYVEMYLVDSHTGESRPFNEFVDLP